THFWSHNENGEVQLSKEECKYLGLSTKLYVNARKKKSHFTYTTKMYKNIHKWQDLRGFDPNTTDFTRYFGYPVYEAVPSDSGQIQELNESE
ncbi:hypothetical protein L218DRAFT_1026474, partial [Marasmius fiardii PR-910]